MPKKGNFDIKTYILNCKKRVLLHFVRALKFTQVLWVYNDSKD